jgi:hypothetical protein
MFYCFLIFVWLSSVWRGNDEWRIDKDMEKEGCDLF